MSSSSDNKAIYAPSPKNGPLRQCEIVSDFVEPWVVPGSMGNTEAGPEIKPKVHPYAVVLSQDCDLELDFLAREEGSVKPDKLLPSILFCEVFALEELVDVNRIEANIYKRVIQNKDERYHFLQEVTSGEDLMGKGLPNLGIDFKRYFTVATEEVYQQFSNATGVRRCYLCSPYLEHLSTRFCYYQFRIALPENHALPRKM